MASKEWMITKVLITALALVSVISICIGGSIVIQDIRHDTINLKANLEANGVEDTQWRLMFSKALEQNELEHDDLVKSDHNLALAIRDFSGIVQGIHDKQDDLIYEVRLNRGKISGLYNPDHEDKVK